MTEYLSDLLSTNGFHPHGYCYLWRADLIWLHVVSDALIGLAYVAIGMTLAYFVRRASGDLPFSRIFVAFGVFIAACGATHFMEIWTLWTPVYWLAGSVKVVTAAASVVTALVLPPLVPIALGTIRTARLSERRRDELEIANARLAAANDELGRLYERLKEADEAKTRFFANVSHELRTPLTLILGSSERLLSGNEASPTQRQQAESIERNAKLLLQQVNDLLDVQKVEAGQMPVHYARLDLARTVRLWGAHFESAADERGIDFSVAAPHSLPAEVDGEKIGRVLFNLLSNAFKFTPSGGTVRCVVDPVGATGQEQGERVRIEVHDSGPGIPPHQRERVFEPFRQLDDSATRRAGGTGLGLAIVKDIVQLHGGSVRIVDSPEGGTLARVELPIRAPAGTAVEEGDGEWIPIMDARLPATSPPGRPAPATPAAERDADLPLVLVVEDNPEMNVFVRGSLAAEYRVACAFDGRQGLEMARSLRPDLILSDIMMPEMSGDVLLSELRRVPELDSVPVLLLSARADDELRIRLLREGAQDYLTKPFRVEELGARVRNWVAMKRTRDVLRHELDSTLGDVESLARELAARMRELDASLTSTQLALAEAEEANRAKSDFLSVMSHELRTPLNAIVGYADLLELEGEPRLSEVQRTRLARIQASSAHLLRLIEEVLTFARTEAGREQPQLEGFDLATLTRETLALLERAAAEKGLALEASTPEPPLHIVSDPHKVRQILLNLVGNAIKFTDSGRVTVALQQDVDGALLRVRDTGPGIAPEHRERIFEPFWQVDSTKTRRFGGTGLGLTITRQLTTLLGGTIQVGSADGAGTEFLVHLPSLHEAEAGTVSAG
jgi:signal transduction histidine kinase